MPLYPPRSEPIKKKEQLSQREIEFQSAIKSNVENEKLNKVAEKYRLAQLSILKAKIHEIRDKEFQDKSHNGDIVKLENEILTWTNKNCSRNS